jgi:antitoxin component YwqK of YwqJK toxin-antitoxin module
LQNWDGSKYIGEWQNGNKHGHGVSYHPNGIKEYDGDWRNDERHGRGTEYHSNGNVLYIGGWKDGKKHGSGSFYCWLLGKKYEGVWKDGKLSTLNAQIIPNKKNTFPNYHNNIFMDNDEAEH